MRKRKKKQRFFSHFSFFCKSFVSASIDPYISKSNKSYPFYAACFTLAATLVQNVTDNQFVRPISPIFYCKDKKNKAKRKHTEINELVLSWHTAFARAWNQANSSNSALQEANNYSIQSKDCFYLPASAHLFTHTQSDAC